MNWLKRIFTPKPPPTRVTTMRNPLVIRAPRLSFLNLIGPAVAHLVAADRAALGQLFRNSEESRNVEPCDVLMVYCEVNDDGRTLKQLVETSQALVVVVASENPGQAYVKASASEPQKFTNLVLTIARNGVSFEHFFRALFTKMFQGMTMPMAWVELAPQAPGIDHEDVPETIFACGAGHVRFEA